MKQCYKSLLMLCMLSIVTACKYDDSALWEKVDSLEDRIESLESKLTQMNNDISSISAVVNALKKQLTITNIATNETGEYIITFSDENQITIRNGKDGVDGKNAPVIGIDVFEGVYYWTQTLNGISSWLTDSNGNKIPVTGEDAVTPRLKINMEGYWMVSYDNGVGYKLMLDDNGNPIQAVGKDGDDGNDGNDGAPGDSFFIDVKIEESELVLTLTDGTVLRLPINVDATPEIESVEISGKVSISEGFKVISLVDEQEINNESFTTRVPKSGQHPQLAFVTNDEGAVLLMSRNFYKKSGNEINVQSTALALVASHPVFAPVEMSDYVELESMVTSSPAFSSLCEEVQKSVEAGRDIFDTSNTALIQKLSAVLDDLCTPVVGVENHLWKKNVPQETSDYFSTNPFKVTPGMDCIEIRNTRLSPPYEYIVRRKGKDNIWEEYEKGVLPTRDSYGFTDIFKPLGEIHLADPVTIQFPIDGEYDFYLDKTTDRAAKELQKTLINDALSIIGASGNDLTDAVIEGGNIIVEGGDVKDYIEYVSRLVEKQKEKITDKGTSPEYLKFLNNAKKFLDKFNVFYGVIKGTANEVARILWAIKAPPYVDFCFSCFEKEIMTCAQSGLKIVSGENQEGCAGNYLNQSLKVRVVSVNPADGTPVHAKYHQVKFEVIQGDGSLSETLVKTDQDGYAETQWKLGNGNKGDKQKVKAVILDVTTGSEVGTSLEFIATVKEDVPIDWTIIANHSDITPYSITIACTYPKVTSDAVFGLIVDKPDGVNSQKDYIAKGDVGDKEYVFHIDNLSPETTYFYVPYVLYEGIYHMGEKIFFDTLPIEIELSKGKLIDLGLSVKWASYNLGASSPEEYGEYFPFKKDMEQTCQTYLINGLRMPTKENVEELVEKCIVKEFFYKGVKGTLVTGPNGNNIFLPRTGTGLWSYKDPNNPVLEIRGGGNNSGSVGTYWTKTVTSREWWLGAYTLHTENYISVGWEDGPGVDPGHYNAYHTIRAVAD